MAAVAPQEYSVHVWRKKDGQTTSVLERCVAYAPGSMDTKEKAARYYLARAIRNGVLVKGDEYEVDVNEDAEDDWTTALTGTV